MVPLGYLAAEGPVTQLIRGTTTTWRDSSALRCAGYLPLKREPTFPGQAKESVNISTNPQEKCVKPYSDHRASGVGNDLEQMELGGVGPADLAHGCRGD